MKRLLFLAIAAIALVAVPSVSHAQFGVLKPFQLGIAGGGTLPMSDLSNTAKTGYNGTVALGINLPLIPVGLRIDGAYNAFSGKSGVGVAGAKLHVMSATGNIVWGLPMVGVSPYLIGGAGLYMPTASAPGVANTSETNFGWNAGAGVKLPLSVFSAFVEARYNRTTFGGNSMEFVPVTFGIMF